MESNSYATSPQMALLLLQERVEQLRSGSRDEAERAAWLDAELRAALWQTSARLARENLVPTEKDEDPVKGDGQSAKESSTPNAITPLPGRGMDMDI